VSASLAAAPADPRADWVARVLGVALPPPAMAAPDGLAAEWAAACAAWHRAAAEVDRQLAGLKAALLASGDGEYEEIAEQALDKVIGPGPAILATALARLDGAEATRLRPAAAALLPALQRFEAQIEAAEGVRVCEDNPVRARVTIRAGYGRGIAALRAVLEAAA
jgi:hypothetical protein